MVPSVCPFDPWRRDRSRNGCIIRCVSFSRSSPPVKKGPFEPGGKVIGLVFTNQILVVIDDPAGGHKLGRGPLGDCNDDRFVSGQLAPCTAEQSCKSPRCRTVSLLLLGLTLLAFLAPAPLGWDGPPT